MSRILGSWSGMRKYLEQEMLADSLKGRVQYSCTSYSNMDDCKVFEIRIDGKTFKRFSMETAAFKTKGMDSQEAWNNYWQEKKSVSVEEKNEFDDEDFCNALKIYRELAIEDALCNSDPIVRMFAVLDRRVGKRTLAKLSANIENQPQWLQILFDLRIEAEK